MFYSSVVLCMHLKAKRQHILLCFSMINESRICVYLFAQQGSDKYYRNGSNLIILLTRDSFFNICQNTFTTNWTNLPKPQWTPLSYGSNASFPSARGNVGYTFIGNDLYMFGGEFVGTYLNELWVLSEDLPNARTGQPVWKQLLPTGTLVRRRCSHGFDSIGTRLYTFGGWCPFCM
jgi:hypothetical protein